MVVSSAIQLVYVITARKILSICLDRDL